MIDLKNKSIILASSSPRRKQLLSLMDIPFLTIVDVIETQRPNDLPPVEVAMSLSLLKSNTIVKNIDVNDIVISADTIVVLNDTILGKPLDKNDEKNMLRLLSGQQHKVITGVTIADKMHSDTFFAETSVWMRSFLDDEIDYYVTRYNPIDKAGAYGIQEWIGAVGIEKIEGSYYNVMGLPTEQLFLHLKNFLQNYE